MKAAGVAAAPLSNHAATRQMRRALIVQWLRKTHGWFGLWGATLGLLFGVSGIWLNHRAVLKLPPVAQQRSTLQLALPTPPPATAQALVAWLQTTLQMTGPPTSVRVEPAQALPWAGPAGLQQPERWLINFGGPHETVQIEAWAGNRSVSVRRVDNGLLGTLMNLHKGVGMPAAWVLLVDTLAGSLILLSISGVALWLLTHRRRVVGLSLFGAGLALTGGLTLAWL
jgi:hypothetical protein